MVTIKTARLMLRPVRTDDLDALIAIHEDPEIARYISGNPHAGRAGAWRMLAIVCGHWYLLGYGQWAVVEAATSEVIGRVGLGNPEGWPGIELQWIISRSRWGRGFATEAAQAALSWAWDHVETDHIISIIQPDNQRSIRVAEKIGERLEGTDTLDGVGVLVYGVHRTRR